jgi:hypothetical protein
MQDHFDTPASSSDATPLHIVRDVPGAEERSAQPSFILSVHIEDI